ncbi:Sulfotransferase domain [Trinorchestia longiramus]|nr:Sulfotransferase domain [Trinorchestia longiramus]
MRFTSTVTRARVIILVLMVVSSRWIISFLDTTELSTDIVKPSSTPFQSSFENHLSPLLTPFSALQSKKRTFLTTHSGNKFFPQKMVFIWTLMRSGSSFFSSMISALPGTYLSIEPVRRKLASHFPVNETNEELLNILYSVCICDPDSIKVSLNFRMKDYCVNLASTRKFFCDTTEFLALMCRRARIHVLKIVTLRLGLMKRFMREHPDLNIKILHLVRDPRPVFTSTQKIAQHKTMLGEDHRDFDTKDICENTRKDLASGVELKQQFQGRYHLVHYEDLAVFPVTTMRGVMEFLGEAYSVQMLTTHRRLTYTFNDYVNEQVFGTDKYSKTWSTGERTRLRWEHPDSKPATAVVSLCVTIGG